MTDISTTWATQLWRWLPLRLSKRQSLSPTVLFRTTLTLDKLLTQQRFEHLDLAFRSLFHADLQGGESSSYGSSDDSRPEISDVRSIHSDTSLAAVRERLSLADYALMDEDALSDYSDPRFRRQTSAMSEASSLHCSHLGRISRSLESVNSILADYGSQRYQNMRTRKSDFPILRNKVPTPLSSPKTVKVPEISVVEVPPRNASNRSNPSVRHVYKRSKSEGGSGNCSPSGENKLLSPKRLLSSVR